MEQLLNECNQEDWRQPFERMIREMKYGIDHRRYVLSERRAGWWPLLTFRPGLRVLDYGCGWGAISFSYARRQAEVTAYDLCHERLRFLQLRATSEGLTNITFVRGGDLLHLPFPDQSFDLVFLIGVLEWIPTSFHDSPLKIQRHFLREISRVLSPTGQLLLAIENRFNWYYFLGQREEHTHLRFISLLPRPLASVYSKLRTGKPLRNLTHSYRASKEILCTSGFKSARIFLPVPDYRLFNRVLDPGNPSTASDFFLERGTSSLESLKNWARSLAAPALAPSFLVVGRRDASVPAFLDELGQALSRQFGTGMPDELPRLTRYQVTRGDAVLVGYKSKQARERLIVHMPASGTAITRAQFAQETLRLLHELLPPAVRSLIPVPRFSGQLSGVTYFVQSMLPGHPATRFLKKEKFDDSLKDHAVNFLAKLRPTSTADSISSDSHWENLVGPDLEQGLTIVEQQLGISSREIRARLGEQLSKREWPVVIGHGDFWPGNLLLSKNGRELLGVIDWDRAIPRSMPLVDLIHFLLYPKVEFDRRTPPSLVGEIVRTGRFENADQPFIDSYLRQMDLTLTEDQLRAFTILYWLLNIGVSRTRGRTDSLFDDDWMDEYVKPASAWLGDFVRGSSQSLAGIH